MLLRIVTMWVPLPKDILGASSQRPTGCLFPKIYWVPLPKDLLGASSQRPTGGVIGDKESVISKEGCFEVVEGLKVYEEHPRCYQAKGSKVEEKLVHLTMVVKFEVLIEKKKMCSLGLMMFNWWMEFWMVHLDELEMKKLL
ncbi:hypothetical protein Tco_1107125 [Tanacetum coccineum]